MKTVIIKKLLSISIRFNKLIFILFTMLLLSCNNNEVEKSKLNLDLNLVTFDYTKLKGKNVRQLKDLIVQKKLDYKYIGDEDIVSGISIEYGNSAMIFVYFNKMEELDFYSDFDLEKVSQKKLNRIIVFKGKSASDQIINIDLKN